MNGQPAQPDDTSAPPAGLSSPDAARRLASEGRNEIPPPRPEPAWRAALRQFRSPLIYILVIAVAIDLTAWWSAGATGVPAEAIAITVILLLNALLGSWQERKAQNALDRLREYTAPRVWAFRDGHAVNIDARELVRGDVVRLDAGDRIPADGILHAPVNLAVDESVLTGESLPADKTSGGEVWAGCLVARGRARLEVTQTGPASAMGKLASLLGGIPQGSTPLEKRLRHFGNRVTRWVIVLVTVIAAAGLWAEGLDRVGPVLLFAVALAVAAVPEGLPAVLTVTLALGVERMARRKAVVRRLSSVESLGSVTVIVTDKTGTLTENRIEVRRLDSADEPTALRAMCVANDAELDGSAGDPIDLALLRFAKSRGTDPGSYRTESPLQSARPFDSDWKFQRATVSDGNRLASYIKGAPETVIARCTLSPDARRRWLDKIEAYAADGFRLLGLAAGDGETEQGLTWLGVALLWDSPRTEVPDALRVARAAGIRVIMVTGDHPGTALTVARAIGMPVNRTAAGTDVGQADGPALRQLVQNTDLFARTTAEQKLRIVMALQEEGEIVAMTGDGVNDAPAIKQADVGIAMGQRGTAVSRDVADLVLMDDNFATIVAAIEEGRGIYENIQKFIRFLFSTNLAEILLVSVGAFVAFLYGLRGADGGLLLPVTAAQLLWINLVTDGAPALALGMDRTPGVMNRPPRPPRAPLLDRNSIRFVLAAGTITATVALVILAGLPRVFGDSADTTRTSVFLFITTGQLVFTYAARHTGTRPAPNRYVHWAVLGSLLVQLAAVTVPALMVALQVTPLPGRNWIIVGGAVALVYGLAELANRLIWPVSPRESRA